MVDEFGPVRLQLDGGPHYRVEVGEIMVHVYALVAVPAQGPARQLRALWIKEGREGRRSVSVQLPSTSCLIISTRPQKPKGLPRHLFKGHLVAIGVHGGQEVDAGFFDQADDALVAPLVLLAHVLHQVEQELPAQHLVPVHPGDVSELRFPCGEGAEKRHGF